IVDVFVTSYNSTVHRAHYHTPHQALLGWKMRGVYESPDTNLNNNDNNENNETDENNDDDNDVDENNNNINNNNNNNNINNNNSSSSSSSSNDNNNNSVSDDEPDSASEDAVQQHLSKILQIHQSINNTLDKYRSKLCQKGSVHRKKHASNTIETGTSVFIAPVHDNNQRTRKRKLQSTYSETGTFKRLTSNNRTAVVVIDNKETRVPIARVKPKHS